MVRTTLSRGIQGPSRLKSGSEFCPRPIRNLTIRLIFLLFFGGVREGTDRILFWES